MLFYVSFMCTAQQLDIHIIYKGTPPLVKYPPGY